jgi:phosphodiesterase/alkaline phosphatase D-like protein
MKNRLTRREVTVAGAGLAAAAYVPPAWASRLLSTEPKVGPGTFADGVASGEPAPDAVTLWSKLRTERARSGAELLVAEDEGLSKIVARATVPTSRAVDGALKARIDGLKPDTIYWYRWRSADGQSELGRTKTAKPADAAGAVLLGTSSCQNWPEGFFNGHADAAKGDPLDLYVFLGDYVYEYGPRSNVRTDETPTVDVETYRDNYRLYRSDKGLRELHRLHPTAHIWDDHEVEDNYTENNPRPSDLQRAAGYAVSTEWLPRLAVGGERHRLYRSIRLGRECEVFLLDQRQYRTGDDDGQPRQILGRTQMDWLKAALKASTARWKIIANQVMFVPLGAGGQGINSDQWDGYPAEQEELRGWIGDQQISDVLFVTGDIHTFFTAEVLRGGTSGRSVATEYVTGSISSTGLPSLGGAATAGIGAANPWIRYANGSDHGWGRLTLDAAEARVAYRTGPLDVEGAPCTDLKVYRQPAGANAFEQVGGSDPVQSLLPTPPAAAALRSERASTPALARRRRRLERLAVRWEGRAEDRVRRARRRRRAAR